MKGKTVVFPLLFLCMLICLILFILPTAGAEAKLTILVYMAGADLESEAGAAGADLEEMTAAVPPDNIQLAVLTGGAKAWKNGIPADQNILWQVTPNGLKQVEASEKRSMGDPEVLQHFLQRSTELFPADQYALILWDHGAGPLAGVCFDERFDSDGLTLNELTNALADSPFAEKKLTFIGFDACLMASAETAAAVAPYAEYMIASQEPLPAAGWNYSFLSAPDLMTDGKTAGESIIDAFAAASEETLSPTTLSCLDLSSMNTLETELDTLFGDLATTLTADNYASAAISRVDTKVIGSSSPTEWDLVDLLDLVEMLESNGMADCSGIREALKKVVVRQYTNEPYVCGLSLYAPFSNKEKYTQNWSLQYDTLDFPQGCRDYVKAFATQLMGQQRSFWRDPDLLEAQEESLRQEISLALKKEEIDELAKTRLLILEQVESQSGPNEYRFLYEVDDDRMHLSLNLATGNGVLYSAYNQEALYLIDEHDEIIAGPLVWRALDEKTSALGLDSGVNGLATFCRVEMQDGHSLFMYLTWIRNSDGSYRLGEIYQLNQIQNLFSVSGRGLQPGDNVEIGGWARRFPEKSAFYEDWDSGDNVLYFRLPYTAESDWHVQFMPLESNAQRVAVFEMTDLQGNPHLSKPIPLENTSVISILDKPITSRYGDLELTMNTAQVYYGAESCLRLVFALQNTGNQSISVQSCETRLNQTILPGYAPYIYETLDPGKEYSFVYDIMSDDLKKAGVDHLDSLGISFRLLQEYSKIDSFWMDMDFSADLTIIVPEKEKEQSPLIQDAQDGITLSIYDLKHVDYGFYGDDVAEIKLENDSGADQTIQAFRIKMDHHSWIIVPCDYSLPKDCKTWIFQVSLGEKAIPYDSPSEIQNITIDMDLKKTLSFTGTPGMQATEKEQIDGK